MNPTTAPSTPARAHDPAVIPLPEGADIYGIMAEFFRPEQAVEAAQAAYDAGYRRMEAYSPMPVEGLAEAMGYTKNRVPRLVLIGGLAGAALAYLMQWYSTALHYPIIVAGRPYHTWPMFIPIAFELTILGASFAAVFGMLAMNGLPRPHHPVFNAPGFVMASRSRFFLCIQANDPLFDRSATLEFLRGLGPREITEVAL